MEEAMGESQVRIACCQVEPVIGEKQENFEKTLRFVDEARRNKAEIIILPELANTGYVFKSRVEAFELAEEVPEGETTRKGKTTLGGMAFISPPVSVNARGVDFTTPQSSWVLRVT